MSGAVFDKSADASAASKRRTDGGPPHADAATLTRKPRERRPMVRAIIAAVCVIPDGATERRALRDFIEKSLTGAGVTVQMIFDKFETMEGAPAPEPPGAEVSGKSGD